ncbi:expressed unknown protein [Seminavis robusta]|uniref:Uncharacterized protein n=1 Tax=Seminavis robusta TaxID=568900 RepID=A0A9N8DD75_9STRA|nr:expressed unknown protein [Seminavis robusta]|eukprot:Sro85_g045210.1 n/a (713) ;mRNA; r:27161-29376
MVETCGTSPPNFHDCSSPSGGQSRGQLVAAENQVSKNSKTTHSKSFGNDETHNNLRGMVVHVAVEAAQKNEPKPIKGEATTTTQVKAQTVKQEETGMAVHVSVEAEPTNEPKPIKGEATTTTNLNAESVKQEETPAPALPKKEKSPVARELEAFEENIKKQGGLIPLETQSTTITAPGDSTNEVKWTRVGLPKMELFKSDCHPQHPGAPPRNNHYRYQPTYEKEIVGLPSLPLSSTSTLPSFNPMYTPNVSFGESTLGGPPLPGEGRRSHSPPGRGTDYYHHQAPYFAPPHEYYPPPYYEYGGSHREQQDLSSKSVQSGNEEEDSGKQSKSKKKTGAYIPIPYYPYRYPPHHHQYHYGPPPYPMHGNSLYPGPSARPNGTTTTNSLDDDKEAAGAKVASTLPVKETQTAGDNEGSTKGPHAADSPKIEATTGNGEVAAKGRVSKSTSSKEGSPMPHLKVSVENSTTGTTSPVPPDHRSPPQSPSRGNDEAALSPPLPSICYLPHSPRSFPPYHPPPPYGYYDYGPPPNGSRGYDHQIPPPYPFEHSHSYALPPPPPPKRTADDVPRREIKNSQSRQRTAVLRERIAFIETKPEWERTQEEHEILKKDEERRVHKNTQSKVRSKKTKDRIEAVSKKPVHERTPEEAAWLDDQMRKRKHKAEGDRMRRKRIKDLGLPLKSTAGQKPGVPARGPLPAHYEAIMAEKAAAAPNHLE